MEIKKYTFSYDSKYDILAIHQKDTKTENSIDFGNFVIDVNKQKDIVALEFINASEMISDLVEQTQKDTHELLEHLSSAQFEVKHQKNFKFIKISLKTDKKTINPVVSIPLSTEPIAALV